MLHVQPSRTTLAVELYAAAISVTLAWSVLAFAAVYPSGYWPLLVSCAVLGLIGIALGNRQGKKITPSIVISVIAIGVVVILQLLPLPFELLSRISPNTDRFLTQYDVGYAAARVIAPLSGVEPDTFARTHALSIDPPRTRLATAFLVAFALFLIGLLHAMTTQLASRLARNIATLGVGVGLAGVIQNAFTLDAVYGSWQTPPGARPFGPFVNRNHFAGWMVMALPLTAGYVRAVVTDRRRLLTDDVRKRLVWLSSKDANVVILASVATLVLMLALMMTTSRSGIGSIACVFLLCVALRARRRPAGSRVSPLGAYLVVAAVACLVWAGVDRLGTRFSALEGSELAGRRGAWKDGLGVAARFPLVGSGLNTYGTAMLLFQTNDLDHHYAAAHNDYVQLAAEGGLLVVIPALVLAGILIQEARRGFRQTHEREGRYWIRLGATAGLAAIGVQELFDFSLQIPANATLFTVLLAISACRRRPLVARPALAEVRNPLSRN